MSRWEIALINIMIIIINKCLFYYLYIVFKTSTPIEWSNEYKKLDTVIFKYIYLCIHDILRIYNILTTPVNSSSAYGCWPVDLVPVWLQETCNNPDAVRWSTRFRNFLISVTMMMMMIIITNLLMFCDLHFIFYILNAVTHFFLSGFKYLWF